MKQIRDHSTDFVNSDLANVKRISSIMTLGLSTRNFTKEMLTQAYITATRTFNHQIPGVDPKDFANAFFYVIKEVPVSLNKQNFMSFLNQRWAMSNYGRTEMADYLKRTRFGLQNLETGDVFIGTKIPDDYYRLTILIARMMHDGCLDAYEPDGDTWRYDISKDPRFTA